MKKLHLNRNGKLIFQQTIYVEEQFKHHHKNSKSKDSVEPKPEKLRDKLNMKLLRNDLFTIIGTMKEEKKNPKKNILVTEKGKFYLVLLVSSS